MKLSRRSLFWNLFAPVCALLIACGAGAAIWLPQMVQRNAEQDAVAAAENTVKQFKMLRKYYSENVISKVTAQKEGAKPSFDHKNNPDAIPLPATMIHDLSESLEKEGMSLRLYSPYPFPNRKGRVLDDFGNEAWEFAKSNPDKTFYKVVTENGSTKVRVAVADRMVAESCVGCHNSHALSPKKDWRLGDVRGILEVDSVIDNQIAGGMQMSYRLLAGMALALLAVAAALYFSFRRAVQKKMFEVADALNDIAHGEGDLTRRLPQEGATEIAGIAAAFNTLMETLQSAMKNVLGHAEKVAASADQVAATAAQVAAGSREQSEASSSTAAAVEQVTVSINQVADNARETSAISQAASQLCGEGEQVARNASAGIMQVAASVEEATKLIEGLDQRSKQIGNIVKVIHDIADQTNLLALNAAIEAARAGEQGRGFAVVADEVRKLAERTSAATNEIAGMISGIQSETRSVVQNMETNASHVNASVALANQAATALARINEGVQKTLERVSDIAASTNEQGHASNEIARNVERIAQMAEENGAAIRDASATAAQLQGLAGDLRGELRKFRT